MKTFLLTLFLLGVAAMVHADQPTPLPDFDSLWNFNKPAETETAFRAILATPEATSDKAYSAELMTQIARTLGLQQKFTEAHALLDTVKALLPEAGPRAYLRYLLERGRVFNSSKQTESALPLFVEAWNKGEAGGFDNLAVDAAHMCAIAAPPDQKLAWNLKAIALAEKSEDPKARKWLGSLYNNIGWDYFEQKQYDLALDMFTKAVAFRDLMNQPTQLRIAKWSVAKTYRMLGKIETALEMQRQLEIEWQESGEDQDGYVFEEIAECLLALERTEDAIPYFAKAYELLSKDEWLVRDELPRLERMKELGRVK
ncbi:MAG: hypothetical protein IPH75_11150 [bacterium]|nr:hypothetical protein [bacterium]